jgi:hypothetical protein
MNTFLMVSVMKTVKRTLLLFIGLSLATLAAAAISKVSPAQGITTRSNSSSEKTRMAGLKSTNVLADIAREMVMRSTTNSQVGKIIHISARVLVSKQILSAAVVTNNAPFLMRG